MFEDVENRRKRKNSILFHENSPCLETLRSLVESQDRRVLILWIFDLIKGPVERLEQVCPNITTPKEAVRTCDKWSRGEVLMKDAKAAILACHRETKSLDDPESIALFHAIGQGLSTIHTKRHAMGFPIYELTSWVHRYQNDYQDQVWKRIQEYIDTLRLCIANVDQIERPWADFLK